MGIYEELKVSRVINAAAWLTIYGGSRMAPNVLEAMADAAHSYVDLFELQDAAGRRIAELTKNEAAYVTSCCSAALTLSALACITGGDLRAITRMPEGDGLPKEIIMHCTHRIPYDRAIDMSGAKIVQIGNVMQTREWELEAAIGPKTAAVLYVAGDHLKGALDLPTTISIAHKLGVPVIVDAAAQLPPVSNFWHFSRDLGADLVLFSGGKVLRGPQASGFIVGSERWVSAVRAIGSPNHGPGRAFKVGKEEIAGLVRAIENFVVQDHTALLEKYEQTVKTWIDELNKINGVSAQREFPGLAGRPIPRLRINVDAQVVGKSQVEIREELRLGSPSIMVLGDREQLYVTPETLKEGEAEIVLARLQDCLTA